MTSSPPKAVQAKVMSIDGRPSKILGDYQLLAELARGGMGRVYLARRAGEAGFERLFAIKVMHHHMSENQDAVLMLLDEAHIASQLHHPNVVSVTDVGTYDGGYYLAMDYVEGGSLHELLKRNRNERPPALLVAIMLDALNGLHAVHCLKDADGRPRNVVHRDVSPHNLLIGTDGTCRVTDFGVAKANARFSHTLAGIHKGKIAYMPPEQLRGEGEVDARADVWATGLTLYQALTSYHPFRGPNDAATIQNTLSRVIPPPSTVGLKPPRCFDDAIMTALARAPQDRYATARHFGDALRRVAIANDMLGSPGEVAAWLDATLGEDLADRRRKIHSIKGQSGTNSSLPVLQRFSGTYSITRGNEGSDDSGPEIEVEPTRLDTSASEHPMAFDEPQKRLFLWLGAGAGGAVVLALLVVIAVLLASSDGAEEASEHIAPEAPRAAASAEIRVQPPAESVGVEAPMVAPMEEPAPVEPEASAEAQPSTRVRPRFWRRPEHVQTPMASTAVESPPERAVERSVERASETAMEPATRMERGLDSNPYLRGE
jgi:serine/threonine protein kinase